MDNVVISGTHTHSGPGGFLTYLMYDMPSLGFVKSTYMALADGIYEVINFILNDLFKIFVSLPIFATPASYMKN